MSKFTKVSPYRAGSPRFGNRDHEPFDNSVKTYQLSPEEHAKYKNDLKKEKKKVAVTEKKVRKGRPAKLNITVTEYVKLSSDGLLDKEIAKQKNILPSTLANWKHRNKIKIETEIAKQWVEKEKVEKDKYDELKQEYEKLKAQLEQKLKSNEAALDYQKMYNELSESYEKLVHEAEEAEGKVRDLENDNSLLKIKIEQLEQDVLNADYRVEQYENAYKEFNAELKALRKLSLAHLQKAVKEGA